MRTPISIAVMVLGPIATLLLWAHLSPPEWGGTSWTVVIVAAGIGLLGLAASGLPLAQKAALSIVYAVLCGLILPFAALLAECSTGNCL